MANHITNDMGETVVARGMPGSQEWMATAYPALCSELRSMRREEALTIVKSRFSGIAVDSMMMAAGFRSIYDCDVCSGRGYLDDFEERFPCWKCSPEREED